MQTRHSIQDYVDVVHQGIAKKFNAQKPRKVLIVGAGLAGLSAAYEIPEILKSGICHRASENFRSTGIKIFRF